MKKDVFKIDNYFIIIGTLFLIAGLVTILLDPRTYDSYTENPILRLNMAISGLLLLVVGIYYRKKENKIHSIWDALEKNKEARLRDLEASLGLSRSFILDTLNTLMHSLVLIMCTSRLKIRL